MGGRAPTSTTALRVFTASPATIGRPVPRGTATTTPTPRAATSTRSSPPCHLGHLRIYFFQVIDIVSNVVHDAPGPFQIKLSTDLCARPMTSWPAPPARSSRPALRCPSTTAFASVEAGEIQPVMGDCQGDRHDPQSRLVLATRPRPPADPPCGDSRPRSADTNGRGSYSGPAAACRPSATSPRSPVSTDDVLGFPDDVELPAHGCAHRRIVLLPPGRYRCRAAALASPGQLHLQTVRLTALTASSSGHSVTPPGQPSAAIWAARPQASCVFFEGAVSKGTAPVIGGTRLADPCRASLSARTPTRRSTTPPHRRTTSSRRPRPTQSVTVTDSAAAARGDRRPPTTSVIVPKKVFARRRRPRSPCPGRPRSPVRHRDRHGHHHCQRQAHPTVALVGALAKLSTG